MGRQGLKKEKQKKPQQTQIRALYDGRKDLFHPCLPPKKKIFPKSYRIMKYIWYVDGVFSVLINLSEVFRLVGFHHVSSHYSSIMI